MCSLFILLQKNEEVVSSASCQWQALGEDGKANTPFPSAPEHALLGEGQAGRSRERKD